MIYEYVTYIKLSQLSYLFFFLFYFKICLFYIAVKN